jgi:hypothetical protein
MENNELQTLLDKVSTITKKYDELAKSTGEKYNIFSIMSMEWNEVYTHSAIIGDLLNPQGSHGQGKVFLKSFLEIINKKFEIEILPFSNLVNEKICERTISSSNDWEKVSGGRIDLIIEDSKQILLIENKIYAKDQEYQLIRYYNYAKLKNKVFYIIYLTLDQAVLNDEKTYDVIGLRQKITGKNFHYSKKADYEKYKTDNNNKTNNYYCLYYPITYTNEILEWLEECIKISENIPLISETLKQYRNNVKNITNQTINNTMSEEIVNKMRKSLKESFEIKNNIWKLQEELYLNFMKLIKQYAERNNMVVNEINLEVNKEYGLYLKPNSWKEIEIVVIFNDRNYTNLYFGISSIEKTELNERENLRLKFKNKGFELNEYTISKCPRYNNWADNAEIWEDIAKGTEGETFKEITEGILEIINIEKS